MSPCPFCLETDLLFGEVLEQNDLVYLVTLPGPVLTTSLMIIPQRHVETPFELSEEEWLAVKAMLDKAREVLDAEAVAGCNIGWNVGEVGGQHVSHVHLHVIGRFADEPLAGKGIRHALKSPANRRPETSS